MTEDFEFNMFRLIGLIISLVIIIIGIYLMFVPDLAILGIILFIIGILITICSVTNVLDAVFQP